MMNGNKNNYVEYARIKNYLIDKLGYSLNSAISVIDKLRNSDPKIKKAFVKWFNTGEMPDKALFGVNYSELLKLRNLNPVSTFVAIDWYRREPDEAYETLAGHNPDGVDLSAELSDETVRSLMERYAIKAPEIVENTEDITCE